MNIFIKNLRFKSIMCVVSILSFFVFLSSSVNAATPVVANMIPNQEAYNGQMFGMSFNVDHVFNDADEDDLSVNVKQADDTNLPEWLSKTVGTVYTGPAYTSLVGTYNTTGEARGVAVVGNYAYVADYTSGLQIIDISNLSNPNLVETYSTTGNAYEVAIVGNYAYVAAHTSGLQIIDISNPSNPSLLGAYDTTGEAIGVTVVDNYAYVTDANAGLQIIDISNPSSPDLVGTYDTTGWAYKVVVVGNYAYVADYISGLQIINISNPSSPSLVGTYNTTGEARGVAVVGNYAYVADYASGLQIIDISDPSSPNLVGTYDTIDIARGVTVVGNYAYVADSGSGLQIIDISDPSSPNLAGTYNTIDEARGVAVVGNYVYVADNNSGLQIIEISNEGISLDGVPGFFDMGTLNLKVTASDGSDEVSTTFSINVLESTTNNKPTVTAQEYKKSQNASLRFNKEQFIAAFQDDDSDELSKIQIMSLPDYGKLKLSGVDVWLDQEIDVGDIDNLSYVPEKDWTGTTTFEWRGFDGTTYSDEGVVTINVNPSWIEAWWPVVTGGTVAVIGAGAAVVGGVTLWLCRRQLAKSCCADKPKEQLKKIEMDENEV